MLLPDTGKALPAPAFPGGGHSAGQAAREHGRGMRGGELYGAQAGGAGTGGCLRQAGRDWKKLQVMCAGEAMGKKRPEQHGGKA